MVRIGMSVVPVGQPIVRVRRGMSVVTVGGMFVVTVGQAIVRVRRGLSPRGLVNGGVESLAMRTGHPSDFCRRKRSSGQQQGRRYRDRA